MTRKLISVGGHRDRFQNVLPAKCVRGGTHTKSLGLVSAWSRFTVLTENYEYFAMFFLNFKN